MPDNKYDTNKTIARTQNTHTHNSQWPLLISIMPNTEPAAEASGADRFTHFAITALKHFFHKQCTVYFDIKP